MSDFPPNGGSQEFPEQNPYQAPQGGPGQGYSGPRPDIPNYLVPAILVTIFCCWPFGIPAIIFAAQVNTKLDEGNIAGAQDASNKAKMWSIAAAGSWAVAMFLIFAFFICAGIAGNM